MSRRQRTVFWRTMGDAEVRHGSHGAGPAGYAEQRPYRRGDRIAPEALPEVVLDVGALLPARQEARQQDRPERARDGGRERGWELER